MARWITRCKQHLLSLNIQTSAAYNTSESNARLDAGLAERKTAGDGGEERQERELRLRCQRHPGQQDRGRREAYVCLRRDPASGGALWHDAAGVHVQRVGAAASSAISTGISTYIGAWIPGAESASSALQVTYSTVTNLVVSTNVEAVSTSVRVMTQNRSSTTSQTNTRAQIQERTTRVRASPIRPFRNTVVCM